MHMAGLHRESAVSRSDELYQRALAVSPGGVHSPVRAFASVGGSPVFMQSASGAQLCDVDGNNYTDYCMAFGPLIFGHADPQTADAAAAALRDGWSFGTAEPWSLELAELIQSRIPWAERVRFVNSGTEAVMSALRLARAATNRVHILKFADCYHGHVDSMLVAAGSGMQGVAISAGIDPRVAESTLIVRLNDIDELRTAFKHYGEQLAAAIIEPLPANHGLQPLQQEFLQELARLCKETGALLIFDEVISGFRVAFGGCAELSGIQPDIVTWGKVIGGGFPVGAYAGSAGLMQHIAPAGEVYQAGTLSANPLAMRAGLSALQRLQDGTVYRRLEALGAQLEAGLSGHNTIAIRRTGSVFWLHDINTANDAADLHQARLLPSYPQLFHHLLANGIYFPPSPAEVCFLSAAHTPGDIDQLVSALASFKPQNS